MLHLTVNVGVQINHWPLGNNKSITKPPHGKHHQALVSSVILSLHLFPDTMSSIQTTSFHSRDDVIDDVDRPHKRAKLEDNKEIIVVDVEDLEDKDEPLQDQLHEKETLLPPSHALLSAPPPVYTEDGSMQKIMETDVGISEYVGHDVPMIKGIIKQR